MSKGNRIKSYKDIVNRPIYTEILDLLTKNNKSMTAKEIRTSLFPKMKEQTLNAYLKNLVNQNLIEKKTGKSGNRHINTYRMHVSNDFFQLQTDSTSPKNIDELNRESMQKNTFFPTIPIKPDKGLSLGRIVSGFDHMIEDFNKNNKLYIFSWDKIPGNDDGKLIEFLNQKFGIEWIKEAKIEKIINSLLN